MDTKDPSPSTPQDEDPHTRRMGEGSLSETHAIQPDPTARSDPNQAGPTDRTVADHPPSTANSPFGPGREPQDPGVLPTSLQSRYHLVRVLGKGGFANVYLAYDEILDQEVAIKILKLSLATTADRERFLFEARVGAKLRHPNIVTVFDIMQTPEGLQMIMEYISGGTLGDRIKLKGALRPREVVNIARQVALALAYAHRHDFVHRDVKPANVFLSTDEIVKLGDFGIASHSTVHEYTQTGMIVGTPLYMSPEQAMDSRDVDPRADIFALGLMLYHMLSGVPPRVMDLDAVPREFHSIIRKATVQDRQHRLVSADQFIAMLDRIGVGSGAVTASQSASVDDAHLETPPPAMPDAVRIESEEDSDEVFGETVTDRKIEAAPEPPPGILVEDLAMETSEPQAVEQSASDEVKSRSNIRWIVGATIVLFVTLTVSGFWFLSKRRGDGDRTAQAGVGDVPALATPSPTASPSPSPSMTPSPSPSPTPTSTETPTPTPTLTPIPTPIPPPTVEQAIARLEKENRNVRIALRNYRDAGDTTQQFPMRKQSLDFGIQKLESARDQSPRNPLVHLLLARGYKDRSDLIRRQRNLTAARGDFDRASREVTTALDWNKKLPRPIVLDDAALCRVLHVTQDELQRLRKPPPPKRNPRRPAP